MGKVFRKRRKKGVTAHQCGKTQRQNLRLCGRETSPSFIDALWKGEKNISSIKGEYGSERAVDVERRKVLIGSRS